MTMKREILCGILSSSTVRERDPDAQVLYVPAELHDRYSLGSNGTGYLVGASFCSNKSTVTMKLGDEAAGLYSKYNALAESQEATALAPSSVPAPTPA
ncbi:hypothetical protein F6B41_19655 [Microbacterium lushaniae]|nr:hypothetical protein F6B41_26845 [Microbacterium lushaniae]KAA9151810.1 hypothetical protein F6B41_19655 [Microbacterium lushaniae]